MKKLTMILVAALLVGLILPTAFAQPGGEVIIGSASAAAGETVTVRIAVNNCEDAKSIYIVPEYDENALELVSGNWLLNGMLADNWTPAFGDAVITFASNSDVNKDIFELTFKVKENASAGTVAEVGCDITLKTMKNGSEVPVSLKITEGAITVSGGEAPADGKMIIGSATAAAGETVTVKVTAGDCADAKSIYIVPQYDTSVLEMVSGKWLLDGMLADDWNPTLGDAVITFGSNTNVNGDIFELTFKVKENASAGTVAKVGCDVTLKTMKNGSEVPVSLKITEGAITVSGGEAPTDGKMIIGSATAVAGETVTVKVTAGDCAEAKSIYIVPQYDMNVLEMVSGKWLLQGMLADDWNPSLGDAVITFGSNTDVNGDIFELTFKVKENASAGTVAKVGCEVTVKTMKGSNEVSVPVKVTEGTIKVAEKQCVHKWMVATCEKAKTCSLCGQTEGTPLGHKWVAANCEKAKTCSVCKKTDGEALGHKWVEATCEAAKTCSVCKKTDGEALGHKWVDATCEAAKTCSVCGKTEGEALGHKWDDATCEVAKTCSVCEKTEGEALGHQYENGACVRCGLGECEKNGHKWVEATCEAPKTCSVCKKTEGEALGHKWAEATCEAAKTCSVCGKTEGEALGHKWVDATCEAAKTCSVCGKTEGEALGHKWAEATCEVAKTCSVCGKTEGEPLGHKWVDATCETAKTCSACQKTEGDPLGHQFVEGVCSGCGKKKTNVSVYAEVVRQTIASCNGKAYGILYDVDDNGTDELIMLYSAMELTQDPEDAMPATFYSVYTADGNTVIPLIEKELLYYEVGGPSGFVAVVEIDGEKHIATHSSSGEVGPISYRGGEWTVYSVNGTALNRTTEISYEEVYSNVEGCVLYDESFAIIDGTKQDYSVLEAWIEKLSYVLKIDPRTIKPDSGIMSLQELLDDLLAQEPSEAVAGDVNSDGKADYSDALLILRASIGLEEITEEQKRIADVTGDGKPDYSDALKILRASIGLETLN